MKGLMPHALVFCAIMHVLTIILFLRGFFPEKRSFRGFSNHSEIHDALVKEKFPASNILQPARSYDRIVFMVIDAMREDFIFDSKFSKNMNFTHSLLTKGHGQGFIAKAGAPTVTLPRIKAIITGGIPGFFDVFGNLEADRVDDDNWVSQLAIHKRQITFFGDDTWLKLFPNVFMEVDNNVTRHLKSVLNVKNSTHTKWDVMILHYLGLDHLGHTSGPYGPLIPAKLREMDNVIKYIHEQLVEKDSIENKKSALLVCGDHGMSNAGSHGGSTELEINVPFLVLPAAAFDKTNGKDVSKHPEKILQIDIAPTISAFMGIPIPKNNLGKIILPVIKLPLKPRLYWLFANANQVYEVFRNFKGTSMSLIDQCHVTHKKAIKQHKHFLNSQNEVDGNYAESLYISAIECLRDDVSSRLLDYDMCAIYASIIYFILFTEMHLTGAFLIFAALVQIFSLGSSSFVEEEHQVWPENYALLSFLVLISLILITVVSFNDQAYVENVIFIFALLLICLTKVTNGDLYLSSNHSQDFDKSQSRHNVGDERETMILY
ncbi:GPI ethanolamine phosphate transferase 2 [Nymphon striatum]|nr:GPI ethanolamine phosphate transferase 2 [Nymphon striatum]